MLCYYNSNFSHKDLLVLLSIIRPTNYITNIKLILWLTDAKLKLNFSNITH